MDKATYHQQTFGEWMRHHRLRIEWPLRKVGAHLDLDTSTVAKIEKGQRVATREQVGKLAELFDEPYDEVLVLYLADRVAEELADEACADDVLRVAEEKIKYLRAKSARQGELEF